MGTLAGMLKEKGFQVTGSDENIYPPMSDQLARWGIPILQGFKAENLESHPDLVVVGNAVSRTNPEVIALVQSGIPFLSLPQALAELFLSSKKSLVVAGTHGKTTTTSLLAWMLHCLGLDPSFLVGGIPKNFHSSYRLGNGDYFVIEGDEYDTAFFDKGPKFWHYQPFQAILTGVEFDHADIYRDLGHLLEAFQKFVELIPPQGTLYFCGENENARKLSSHANCRTVSYGLDPACDVHAANIRFHSEGADFDLVIHQQPLGAFRSPLPGRHNLQNLLGVLALSSNLLKGVKIEPLQQGASTFQGVKRRQEVRGVARGVTVIDDFAHHPTAVAETIDALRKKHPGQKIWGVFEPRSNTSRRAVFQEAFAKALSNADEILVASVFMPEKVKDGQILNVEEMVQAIRNSGKPAWGNRSVEAIIETLVEKALPGDLVLIMSNGGFENIHERLLADLEKK